MTNEQVCFWLSASQSANADFSWGADDNHTGVIVSNVQIYYKAIFCLSLCELDWMQSHPFHPICPKFMIPWLFPLATITQKPWFLVQLWILTSLIQAHSTQTHTPLLCHSSMAVSWHCNWHPSHLTPLIVTQCVFFPCATFCSPSAP